MDNDDLPVGRILSRRETLALFGMSASALLAACAGRSAVNATAISDTTLRASTTTPLTGGGTVPQAEAATANPTVSGCVVRPEMTEGPYFVDEKLDRPDIRSDPSDGSMRAGVPLVLTFNVVSVADNACSALAGAVVDVWHCDAAGIYSDVTDTGVGFNTVGKQFLRGSQTTDASGAATFTTIYPGWYRGRAAHIHFKIRTAAPSNQAYEFTSQLFFDDALTDQVYTQAPYTSHAGKRDTPNAADGIFQNGGDQMVLALTPTEQGYAAMFAVGLNLTDIAVGQPDGNSMTGGGGFRGGPPPGGRGMATPTR